MELIHNGDARLESLIAYLAELGKGNATRTGYDLHADAISTATALEVNAALHSVLEREADVAPWKVPVSRFIRSVTRSLNAEELPSYPEGHLLARLEAENAEIERALEGMQGVSALAKGGGDAVSGLRTLLRDLTLPGRHYVSLQNELFPLFERASPDHACVKLMWALEDDVLALRKRLCAEGGFADETEFWKVFGDFFVLAGSLVYRERRILFPAAFRSIPESLFARSSAGADADLPASAGAAFASKTGSLTRAELEAVFSVLPLDIAFIGSDDRVKFYSDPPHRIFPRSPAVIGRLVRNCHPPKSVAVVEEILRSFKSGEREKAEFWLTLQGKFVHIEYFAVRGPDGTYLGTLESSMDATHLRSLEGEKRLL